MDPLAFEFQFPWKAHRSRVLRTEELLIGRTIMTKPDLGGSVWLHFSQSGSSSNKLANLRPCLGQAKVLLRCGQITNKECIMSNFSNFKLLIDGMLIEGAG